VDVQAGDSVGIGVFLGTSTPGDGTDFDGDSGGFFVHQDVPIGAADGRSDVYPTFLFDSDAAGHGDGAYVDDLSVLCRGHSYDNAIRGDSPDDGGSYTALEGTSMAAPHVSGVAALVRAVDPGAPPEQVVDAIRKGVTLDSHLTGRTVSGGVVQARGAMDAALAIPNSKPPPPAKPHRPRILSVKVSRRGVVTMVVKGDRRTTGKVKLTANIAAARVRTVARKSFRIGSTGRAKVRLKLSRPAIRQLRRKHKLRLRATVVSKNAAGLTSSRTGTIRLSLRRRR
jgi:subtilisin family serine protease